MIRAPSIARAVVTHGILVGVGAIFSLPFFWLVSTALKADTQVLAMPPVWVPRPVRWDNFPRALEYIPYVQYALNTLRICALSVVGTVLSCSLVAYSLARVRWIGRELVSSLLGKKAGS